MVAAPMDLHAAEALVAEQGADRVTKALAPFLTEARRSRIEAVLDGRMRSVQVAVETPTDPHNAAAVVRSCEAMGALGVHVIGAEPGALRARRTTKGSFHWVRTYHHKALEAFLSQARAQGLRLAGACMDGSLPVTRLPVDEPLCLLFGNEQHGLSPTARRSCDFLFHVPMFGMSESLNLSVAAAVSLFEVMRRKRAMGPSSDLEPAQRDVLRACYFLRSVDPRLVKVLWGPATATATATATAEAHDPQ